MSILSIIKMSIIINVYFEISQCPIADFGILANLSTVCDTAENSGGDTWEIISAVFTWRGRGGGGLRNKS